MTGDCTVAPEASVLVMTTEILRNMIYSGHSLVREVQWVVFDEVHYMRDTERGVIWEESIILLPHAVRFVFLSATIPNAFEFARWVADTHEAPCHLVSTFKRPTPLEHWAMAAGGDGLFKLKGSDGLFRHDNYEALCTAIGEGVQPRKRGLKARSSDLQRLLKLLETRELTPAIVFAFSRKECEGAAMQAKQLAPLPEASQAAVREIFDAAVGTLAVEDRSLEPIERMLPLLLKGVAVHHSGLLPVLKEVVEILFQEGYVRFLFATETFALGLNMPARAVVFSSTSKWDGESFRPPTSAEYTQMAGMPRTQ